MDPGRILMMGRNCGPGVRGIDGSARAPRYSFPAMRTASGVLSAAIAVALGGLGIWTMATKDVQGGRHEAGELMIVVAAIPAVAALGLLAWPRQRILRRAAGLLFLALGGLAALYGLFAILYRDHSGGNTYVTFVGHEVDAHLAGGIALLLGSLLILIAIPFLRRTRRFAKPS